MEEDNLSRQIDEVEALSSIYGDDWCTEDEARRIYSIKILDGHKGEFSLTLQVILVLDYPRHAPPTYQLSAPWLRGQERKTLAAQLDEIYCENMGESMIFLWVEKLREYLEGKAMTLSEPTKEDHPSPGGAHSGHTEPATSTTSRATEEDTPPVEPPVAVAEAVQLEEEVTCPEIFHGGKLHDRKSVFQPHLALLESPNQVKVVLDKLREDRKVAAATHNIYAFRICMRENSDMWVSGCEDDGEIHAGSRMLHLLEIMDARNVIVIVTRWYGGIHLGPDRFKHINNCTRDMLEAHNFVKDKGGKKGPKSSKAAKKGK